MTGKLLFFAATCLLALFPAAGRADDTWLKPGANGQPEVQLYFFWSLICPYCAEAHPHIGAIPPCAAIGRRRSLRPRVAVLRRDACRLGRRRNHRRADSPAPRRLSRALAGGTTAAPAQPVEPIHLPLFGAVDPAALSLPALTLVLAGLDAFNPCAFFVLLFLLSMMAHQKNRRRMLIIGGVFVLVSGIMYFAFMAAWLNVFQLFGHLAWATLAAGALAVFVGAVNVKDFFRFGQGFTLSTPESKKPGIFRRSRAILNADSLMAVAVGITWIAARLTKHRGEGNEK